MRLFAALVPPPDVVNHLEEFLDGLRTARRDLRWVPPARYHLTLQFLGSAAPTRSTGSGTAGNVGPAAARR